MRDAVFIVSPKMLNFGSLLPTRPVITAPEWSDLGRQPVVGHLDGPRAPQHRLGEREDALGALRRVRVLVQADESAGDDVWGWVPAKPERVGPRGRRAGLVPGPNDEPGKHVPAAARVFGGAFRCTGVRAAEAPAQAAGRTAPHC